LLVGIVFAIIALFIAWSVFELSITFIPVYMILKDIFFYSEDLPF